MQYISNNFFFFLAGNSWNILKASIWAIYFIFWGAELISPEFLRSQILVLNKSKEPYYFYVIQLSFQM